VELGGMPIDSIKSSLRGLLQIEDEHRPDDGQPT
jgi:hypothetical protein